MAGHVDNEFEPKMFATLQFEIDLKVFFFLFRLKSSWSWISIAKKLMWLAKWSVSVDVDGHNIRKYIELYDSHFWFAFTFTVTLWLLLDKAKVSIWFIASKSK